MSHPNTILDEAIASWPELNREVARTVISKYGQPDEIGEAMLIWMNAGPWKRTVVHAESTEHHWPNMHHDVVEQFIDYRVPPERASDLATFDGSVTILRTRGELSAMCEGEEANFLALNLANDIIAKGVSVSEARGTYIEKAKLMAAKMPDPYLDALRFNVPSDGTADPDILPRDAG